MYGLVWSICPLIFPEAQDGNKSNSPKLDNLRNNNLSFKGSQPAVVHSTVSSTVMNWL